MARARAFGSIRKLPSGRYQARYWHLGKQVAADTTFSAKTDARAWLASIETDMRRGEHIAPLNGTVLFGDYAREWLEHRPLRPRTREVYASQLTHIVAAFGSASLADIAPADVRRWHGKLSRSDLSRNTVAKLYRLFRTIMTTAVDDALIRVNPIAIKGAATERIAERPLLDWPDVERLAEAIEPRFKALVWTAAVAGLRFGELVALDRSCVDLAAGKIRVDRALTFVKGSASTFGPPKSLAAHRTVTVPTAVTAMLTEHIDQYVGPDADAVLFTSVKGSLLLNRYFAPYWLAAKRAAGVDESVRFHDLRHLAGTAAATAGGSLREIMARMGHQSSDAALRYLKAAEARDSEIADAIGARLVS